MNMQEAVEKLESAIDELGGVTYMLSPYQGAYDAIVEVKDYLKTGLSFALDMERRLDERDAHSVRAASKQVSSIVVTAHDGSIKYLIEYDESVKDWLYVYVVEATEVLDSTTLVRRVSEVESREGWYFVKTLTRSAFRGFIVQLTPILEPLAAMHTLADKLHGIGLTDTVDVE